MAEITAAMVMKLRDETSLPMMDCKKALQESGGDFEKAKQMVRRPEIGHDRDRFGERFANFLRFCLFQFVVTVRSVPRFPELLATEEIIGQETPGVQLNRLAEITHSLGALLPQNRCETEPFIG